MPPILKCFDAAFLINADIHPQRREQANEQLARVGIDAERFCAITLSKGSKHLRPSAIALNLSHHAIVSIAKQRGYQSVLIFEDDLIFKNNFEKQWHLVVDKIKLLQYDLFYFYDWRWHDSKGATTLIQISGTLCTHAYAVSERFYDAYLRALNQMQESKATDQILLRIPAEKWAVVPNLVGQQRGVSTITGKLKPLRWSSKDG